MANGLTELTDGNFESEVINSDIPVLVDFWAVWCGPCRMIAPEIEKIADEKAGVLKVGKLNVDENRETAIKYSISSIPSLLLFKNGDVAKKIVGAMPKDKILEEIASFL
jgi:thioredoxin 1